MPAAAPEAAPTPLAAQTDLRPHDIARLRAVAERLDLSVDRLARRVWERVREQPGAPERFAAMPDGGAHLRRRLHEYIRSIWSGDHDARLRNAREHVGSGSLEHGIPLEAYLGAFVLIDDVVIDELVRGLADDPECLSVTLRSYRRVTTTDLLVHLGRSDAARGITPR